MSDIDKFVHGVTMDFLETQEDFIFSKINEFTRSRWDIVVNKKELSMAIQLVRMYKEHGPGIGEVWSTAVRNEAELRRAYNEGFRDGTRSVYEKIEELKEHHNE